jgi:hypothetical protein
VVAPAAEQVYISPMNSLANHTITPENIALIERTIRDAMSAYIVEAISVRPGEDHDGDPVIFIEVQYGLNETPIDAVITGGVMLAVGDRLWSNGEFRFPHIRHLFHEQQANKKLQRVRA